jgi:urease accessory protein
LALLCALRIALFLALPATIKPMIQVSKLIAQGKGLASALIRRAPTVSLDWDVRQKSRFAATDSTGRELAVFLPPGTALRGNDVLVAEDGSVVAVQAAPQPVLRITHCTAHGSPFDLLRAAYHLGNRHVPIELTPTHLQIEPDHVLADLLRSMHLIVTPMDAAFEPESGAYSGHAHGLAHAHAHDHGHGHNHEHEHEYDHAHAHSHAHPHSHDHDHSHDHAHGHEHSHDHAHEHSHDHAHAHEHSHAHDHSGGQDHGHSHDSLPAQPHTHAHRHDHAHPHAHDGAHQHAHEGEHSHPHDPAHPHRH